MSNTNQKRMKKVLIVMFGLVGLFIAPNQLSAQTSAKIGVFDVDIMVQAMPGYRAVDSMLNIYEQDSLRSEYEFAVKEYNRLDSTYKSDSAAKKPGSVLNYQKDQRSQIATTIIYWQQISQQKTEQKRQFLASSLYDKVLNAYSKVLNVNNYLVVLKPGAFEMGSKVENVFEKVAKELNVPLPEQLRSQGPPPEENPASKPSPAGKPAPKKP